MRKDRHADTPRRVYDASASTYLAFVGTDISDVTEDTLDRSMLSEFVALLSSRESRGTVADLGCGPGRVASYLARDEFDVVGVDVSFELLARAQAAHPHLPFVEGRLDELPFASGALAGVVCWYSIIYTPPDLLIDALAEIARAVTPDGTALLAFQTGAGEAVTRTDAHRTGIALTNYLHDVDHVGRQLTATGFDVRSAARRQPSLGHESEPQAFVIAQKR